MKKVTSRYFDYSDQIRIQTLAKKGIISRIFKKKNDKPKYNYTFEFKYKNEKVFMLDITNFIGTVEDNFLSLITLQNLDEHTTVSDCGGSYTTREGKMSVLYHEEVKE